MNDRMSRIVAWLSYLNKAIQGGWAGALTAWGTAMVDGNVSGIEWTGVVFGFLIGFSAVFTAAENGPKPPPPQPIGEPTPGATEDWSPGGELGPRKQIPSDR